MIKHGKRTISAEDEDIVTQITGSMSPVEREPTINTNKDFILTIQQRNFWVEEKGSDITDNTVTIPLSEYITRLYLSNNYYNKEQVNNLIENFKIKIITLESIDDLPQEGDPKYGDPSYIFFVKRDDESPNDIYDEYIWDIETENYEKIGNTDIDLSSYLTIADFEDWVSDHFGEKEDVSNKVTSISSASTNTQYPSAKCVYDEIDAINIMIGEAIIYINQ